MTVSPAGAGVSDVEKKGLRALDERLSRLGLEVELCVIGGAVLPVVFRSASGTRRPSALFGDLETLRSEAVRIQEEAGLDAGWLERAARAVDGLARAEVGAIEAGCVRVFQPPPDYVLALRCARLAQAPDGEKPELRADIVYLARLLGLATAAQVLAAVEPYLPESLLSDALELELVPLLGIAG